MPTHHTIDPIASATERLDVAALQHLRDLHTRSAGEHLIRAVTDASGDTSLAGTPIHVDEVMAAVRHAEQAARADAELRRLDAAYRRLLAAIYANSTVRRPATSIVDVTL
ncbi:hypothetical protein [Microbacterium stercoris]|uniref:Uncharacterized protein n=1 Tax=Microbacterium stercoris TaxID=2820289 RepID=A0A939QRF9_9MICO|nr:hypothetical protein [Microbacterium stercoris]MBO3663698.1 hypothetical protein [Microbacterium stercoris]